MNNSYDLMKIYGIPPAMYSEDNPDDLYLSNLPSLEQIASFNNAMSGQSSQQLSNTPTVNNIPSEYSTPATTIGNQATDISGILMPSGEIGSASAELPNIYTNSQTNGSITQQITDYSNPYPVTAQSIQYLNGFIRTQIGRRAQIQFLMGSSDLVEKDGFLLGVGSNYILINEIGTNDITACDFYNIKFIRFLY